MDELAKIYPQASILSGILHGLFAPAAHPESRVTAMFSRFMDAHRRGDPVAPYFLQELLRDSPAEREQRLSHLNKMSKTVGSLKLFAEGEGDAADVVLEFSHAQLDAKASGDEYSLTGEFYAPEFLRQLGWNSQKEINEILHVQNAEMLSRLAEAEREKREVIENMMAMFAHKFRGPVDSILFNSAHQHDERVYVDAARTMNGLLDVFSIVSTAPEKLQGSLKMDNHGASTPDEVLLHAFILTLVQLLSLRNRRRMSPHYLAYARRYAKVAPNTRLLQWARDETCQEMELALQEAWEAQVGNTIGSATLKTVIDWMAEHLVPVRIEGFAQSQARFSQYGPKASLLIVILTEVLVNAIKHTAPDARDPIVITWVEDDNGTVIACTNPSTKESRTRDASKGSGRGHKFLRLIAEHLDGGIEIDVFSDISRISITIPSSIILGRTT